MECDTLSPKTLFQGDVRYLIPTFQRPYVWNQDDQWEPLWDDVRNTAERYLEELERVGDDKRAEAERNTPSHFLGAVVLQQQPTATVDIEQRHVIDGQQRLTILQLLLDASQEICETLEISPVARRLSKLVLNDDELVGSEADHRFKVWPTNVDRDAFRHAMTNGFPTTDFSNSQIVHAHEFFKLQIKEWLESQPEILQVRAAALETALTGLLQLVVIDLEFADDSHVIFETLNARGTPLIESDLIKNFILYKSREEGGNEESLYSEYWQTLEDEWWRRDVRQGRLIRPRIDVFLNYWLSMRTVTDVPASRVFDTFREYAEPKDIQSVAADISQVGKTYRDLSNVTHPDEMAFMYRWDTMQAGVITPLLLLIFSTPEAQLSPERRRRGLRALESFLVRRMVCRLTTKDYNRMTLDLAEVLQKEGVEAADDVIIKFLQRQSSESRHWPDDETLNNAFLGLPLYHLLTRGRLRLVLEGIEEEFRGPKTEDGAVPKNLTIEHVLPQGWRQHWPLANAVDGIDPRAIERDRLLHSIGNLTLVNSQLNPSLSNGPWEKKREGLNDHSVLFLNKDLLRESYTDHWDESTIRSRSEQLASLAARVWPGPDSWP